MKSAPGTPPDKKSKQKPADAERVRGETPGKEGNDPARVEKNSGTESPTREETISRWEDPVTNQDEQARITNAGGDDSPVVKE